MRLATQRVTVARDPMTVISKEIWPWELPILEEKYGGDLELYGESFADTKNVPDAEIEYVRLGNVHGFDPERKVAYVELAYGRGKEGVKELAKAIRAAGGGKKPGPKAAPSPPAEDEPDDPLG